MRLRPFLTILLTLLLGLTAVAQESKPTYVKIKTNKGSFVIELYDDTPLHKANFLKRVEEGAFVGRRSTA